MSLFLISLILFTVSAFSYSNNDTLRPRYGINFGLNLNIHSAGFKSLPGILSCCPQYDNGFGIGPLFGLSYEYPLSNKFLIDLRAEYQSKNGLLKKDEITPVMVNFDVYKGTFEHSIDATISTINFNPSLKYRILDNLYTNLGADGGIYIQKKLHQKEEITSPSNSGVFLDTKTRVRNEYYSDIPDIAKLNIAIKGGFSYELPLNNSKTLLLVPEIQFAYSFTNVVKDYDWKIHTLTFGLTLKYSPFEKLHLEKNIYHFDTIKIKSENYDKLAYLKGTTTSKSHNEDINDTIYKLHDIYQTDTLYIPKIKSVKKAYFIDTIRTKSEEIDSPQITFGKEIVKSSQEVNADSVITYENIHRTDSLLIPYEKRIITNQHDDTTFVITKVYKDTTFRFGKEFQTQKTNRINDTIFVYQEITQTDTMFIPQSKIIPINPQLFIYGVIPNGEAIPICNITLRMQYTTEVYPLLPYIFFDNNSEQIPLRYNKIESFNTFNENELTPNPLEIHHNILNIVGERLNQNKTAKLVLTGFSDQSTENGSCLLARARAMEVKNYLTSVLNVNPDQVIVKVDSRNCSTPETMRTITDDGRAENRRVELESDFPGLLSPVNGRKYLDPIQTKPDSILFKITGIDNKSIKYWTLNISGNQKLIYTKNGDVIPNELGYKISKNDIKNLQPGDVIYMEFKIQDKADKTYVMQKDIEIIKDTDEYEIQRLTLTLFKVASSTLTEAMKKETSNFLKLLDAHSEVNIKGFCDKLGTEAFNINLADIRSREINNFIHKTSPSAKIKSVEAVGSKELPPGIETYNTPEERFLSRTVEIEIKKLIRK